MSHAIVLLLYSQKGTFVAACMHAKLHYSFEELASTIVSINLVEDSYLSNKCFSNFFQRVLKKDYNQVIFHFHFLLNLAEFIQSQKL